MTCGNTYCHDNAIEGAQYCARHMEEATLAVAAYNAQMAEFKEMGPKDYAFMKIDWRIVGTSLAWILGIPLATVIVMITLKVLWG